MYTIMCCNFGYELYHALHGITNALTQLLYIESDASGGVSSGSRRPVSGFGGEVTKKTSDASLPGDLHSDRLTNLTPQHFQGGRAEALGALCRCVCVCVCIWFFFFFFFFFFFIIIITI